MLAFIFLEGSFGAEFIYLLIGIFLALILSLGFTGTLILFIINSIKNKKKSRKYYLLTFFISMLIGLLGTGIICGGSF